MAAEGSPEPPSARETPVTKRVSTQEFVMTKNHTQRIEAPKAENVCWRHDRNPNNPVAGVWSGWSRATMFPGQTFETEL